VLAQPTVIVDHYARDIHALLDRSRRCTHAAITTAQAELGHTRARVAALSPAATLARGYAVLQTVTGRVVRQPADTAIGDSLRARLANGELAVVVTGEVT
jgi:exodeoxyribonuclease VII large subunit